SRISLYVGVGATILAMVPAVVLGVTTAYYRGWYDYILQRFVDTIQALPSLLILIVIMAILGPSLLNVIIALSFSRAVTGSRIMRSSTMSIMNEMYIEAARASGATSFRIMFRHLLPNIVPTV